MTRRRRRTVGLALLAVLGVGWGVGQMMRDADPPNVWVEAPARAEVGAPFPVRLSADEPARYRLTYAGATLSAVEQAWTATPVAAPGVRELLVVAEDAAGNRTEVRRAVEGVTPADVTPRVVGGARPGAPFHVALDVAPPDAPLDDLAVRVDGRDLVVHRDEDGLVAFGAVPLQRGAGRLDGVVTWRDGLDRDRVRAFAVPFGPLATPHQDLNVDAATLSVITPEARTLEAERFAAATADPRDPPRWTAPFRLPIEGRGTSGFATSRTYAPGGPVSFHVGEDVAVPTGTPIAATNDGVVRLAEALPIKGGTVVLDHGAGVTSRHYHLSTIAVQAGDVLAAGDVLGAVGNTGLSTGPHLHWEVRVDGAPSDPLAWVGRTRP